MNIALTRHQLAVIWFHLEDIDYDSISEKACDELEDIKDILLDVVTKAKGVAHE